MALNPKDKETGRLAREMVALTGETLTDAIRNRWPSGWSVSDYAVVMARPVLRPAWKHSARNAPPCPITTRHAEIAIDAFRRFGKGRHRAGLNIGDCFSYALAMAPGQTLLFKGNNFSHTDIRPALPG